MANNPGPFTFKGTGTYIVGKGEVAVIDPGPDSAHLEAILKAVEGERVTHILITHHHSDHSPLAGPLKARTGAVIYGCAVQGQDEDDGGVKMEAGHDTTSRPTSPCAAAARCRGPRLDAGGHPDARPHLQPPLLRVAGRERVFSGDCAMRL